MSPAIEDHLRQALEHQRAGRAEAAAAAFRQALALRPDLTDVWFDMARMLRAARQPEASLDAYAEALKRGVSGPEEAHLNRAVILSEDLHRPEAAEVELTVALDLNPAYVPAWLNLGNLHEDRGDRDAARAAYEQVLALAPKDRLALARLGGLARIKDAGDPLIARVKKALGALGQDGEARLAKADLGFSLGRMLDAAGAYDEAFQAYAEANAASRAVSGARYDRAAQEQAVDRLISAFPAPRGVTGEATGAPVFICGMFRSGSTLAEQVLAAHPRVTPGGELDLVPLMARRALAPFPESLASLDEDRIRTFADAYLGEVRRRFPDADLVTDKRPDNFMYVGLIKTLFPDARIVHTRRNAMDNCLSAWFLHLSHAMPWALDLEDAAHWLIQQERLMDHWKALWPDDVHTLDYDALIADPEPVVRELLAFCGLDWDPACLEFHTLRNAVRTASVWQVREPLYQRSSGRWRNYERHLGPLKMALEVPT